MTSGGAERLVYMANQIAQFFNAQPGNVAARCVADHLRAYWAPDMRRAIVAHLEAGGAGLRPVAQEAVTLLGSGRAAQAADDGRDALESDHDAG